MRLSFSLASGSKGARKTGLSCDFEDDAPILLFGQQCATGGRDTYRSSCRFGTGGKRPMHYVPPTNSTLLFKWTITLLQETAAPTGLI